MKINKLTKNNYIEICEELRKTLNTEYISINNACHKLISIDTIDDQKYGIMIMISLSGYFDRQFRYYITSKSSLYIDLENNITVSDTLYNNIPEEIMEISIPINIHNVYWNTSYSSRNTLDFTQPELDENTSSTAIENYTRNQLFKNPLDELIEKSKEKDFDISDQKMDDKYRYYSYKLDKYIKEDNLENVVTLYYEVIQLPIDINIIPHDMLVNIKLAKEYICAKLLL